MKLPSDALDRFAKEYRFVAKKINDEADPRRKLYFFSALFTEISRTLNWHWDSDLVLLHWVLQSTHNTLNAMLQSPTPWVHPPQAVALTDRLAGIADELANFMEQGASDSNFHEIVAKIAVIGYLATNHGGYLLEKGLVPTETSGQKPPSSRSRASARR